MNWILRKFGRKILCTSPTLFYMGEEYVLPLKSELGRVVDSNGKKMDTGIEAEEDVNLFVRAINRGFQP